MKRVLLLVLFIFSAFVSRPAHAGPLDVTATISSTANGADFNYTIILSNLSSSTDSLETFWFAWVPGEDFMKTHPISETPPTGWTDKVTNGGANDGFAIQFITSTDPLAPGNSLTFKFTSADTPAQIAGDSFFYPGTPVETAFVYQGQPFHGDSLQIVVQSVPEPSTMILGIVGFLGCFADCRVRKAIARRTASRLVSKGG